MSFCLDDRRFVLDVTLTGRWPAPTAAESSAGMPDSPQKSSKPTGADHFLIVGIGASAGGLEACRKLVAAVPAGSGAAFVLIQHLDPDHVSLIADILADHGRLMIRHARDGERIEPDHLYVISPGTYLAVERGMLRVTAPLARHGTRMPIDFFFESLARDCGPRAVAIILSGTGADGSVGLKTIKLHSGLVIAQDPDEAGYDGMPNSAIATGAVDLVLPVASMPAAFASHAGARSAAKGGRRPAAEKTVGARASEKALNDIVALLRRNTPHDFTHYKPGTLERRIARRMAISAIQPATMERYLDLLAHDQAELDLLSKDLLINVTSFFRDPAVFQFLANQIIPELVTAQQANRPIRIWLVGCSTGEEAYSLAMLFREYMVNSGQLPKVQFFASDLDADAIAMAREGLYPSTIAAEVSHERLARFFAKEGKFYRVLPEVRAMIVFTVQDVLVDPPFSRLDMVLCRNLLIYLLPEAQERVFALLHFALRKDGILVLGNAEAVNERDDRYTLLSKTTHIYRHVGQHRVGDHRFRISGRDERTSPRAPRSLAGLRQAELAELCRRLVLENHTPAGILINRRNECLFSLGPINRFVHVAPGHPTQDLFAMVLPGMRTRLRSAIQRAIETNGRVVVDGVAELDGSAPNYRLDVLPVVHDGEELLLICFPDVPAPGPAQVGAGAIPQTQADKALEEELEATRADLQAAIHDLEISSDEQKAINDEASSLNEELQSTNEELLTSKEELQSINEETTALNTQLYEALSRQRTTSNDLQNVLNSTNVATIFLDGDLCIRFFTPATKSLFNVIQSDIGRPLSDLKALSVDTTLLTDAHAILTDHATMEREVEAQNDIWYIRRILPYRADDGAVEGVVITFVDSTERRLITKALNAARHDAEQASVAKSRFLAAASHDLRQPLQSLSLMRGVLSKKIRDGKTVEALELLGRVDETSTAMSNMLDSLLDITQIDSGNVQPEFTDFPVGDLLGQLLQEFDPVAKAQGLEIRSVPCRVTIHSDRHMLGQMIRNLLSNALKYTQHGKILLGCRRHGDMLAIKIWDTGIGIPTTELAAVFDEYHQIDSGARARNRGLGLGLSIVRRLGKLLDHQVRVRSVFGKGSEFSIDIKLPPSTPRSADDNSSHAIKSAPAIAPARAGAILVVEDDPEVRELLGIMLRDEGHHITIAPDGVAALALLDDGMMRPDLLLTDFNLPNGTRQARLVH